MRAGAPFRPDDLLALDELLERATAVVTMGEVFAGATDPRIIGLRHDVDNLIEPAVAFAEWEAERGYRSTYFILHTAPYWQDKPLLEESLELIAERGHEIGLHNNALAEAIRTERDPLEIIEEAVGELRGYGHRVHGVVAHGDSLCYEHGFINDEVFLESARPEYGAPDRTVAGVKLTPVLRGLFGFDYDSIWLERGQYLSDSGGAWSQPFDETAAYFPFEGQLHMLVHPDWWVQAFTGFLEEVAAVNG